MSHKLKEINGDTMQQRSNNNGTQQENGNGNDFSTRKSALTPLEYRVTQQRETERPYSNKYNKHWERGVYSCVVCSVPLFKSETKFESKSGWPAFYNVVDPQRVKLTPDLSHIGANLLLLVAKPDLARTEVSCAHCNAHLGHLFKDGPKPTGLRYCINSASLNFRAADGTEDKIYNTPIDPNLSNGNGIDPAPVKEFACNPENMCSRPPPATTTVQKPVSSTSKKSARENFFSSVSENHTNGPLPPMGALCLNNQSCQYSKPKPSPDVIQKSPVQVKSLVSNGAENQVSSSSNGSCSFNNSSTSTGKETFPNALPTPLTQLSTKPKYQFTKGASLTAARINFFQKISVKQQDPANQSQSRWAATFNSRWSSNKPASSPSDSLENHSSAGSRFPSSCSSGSLCTSTASQQSRPDDDIPPPQPRRSTSSFFSRSPSHLERVSTPPRTVALRETRL